MHNSYRAGCVSSSGIPGESEAFGPKLWFGWGPNTNRFFPDFFLKQAQK